MEHFVTLVVSEWYQRSDKKKFSVCLCQVSYSVLQPTAVYFKEPFGSIILYTELALEYLFGLCTQELKYGEFTRVF
jgi:hypothetical protein